MGSSAFGRIAWSKLAALGVSIGLALAAFGQTPTAKESPAQLKLALSLFKDSRFSTPQGDLQNSCASCHLMDEDPQGMRAHTDFFARSWVPWRAGDPRRDGLRNAPTIFDSASMARLHFDGEFASLEDLVKGTLTGRAMGWLPGEETQSFDRIYKIILNDAAPGDDKSTYRLDFKAAYGVDPETLSRDEVIDRVVKALADYIRTLKSGRTTAYDRFIQANGLEIGPGEDGDSNLLGKGMLGKVMTLEKQRALRLPQGFDKAALQGMKIFFRTSGRGAVGNCVSCHTPPLFTDSSFHNIGISQAEYDQVNGDGSFAKLKIPTASEAHRPSTQFRETPSKRKADTADLGYWNFVDLKASTLRRTDESDDHFLRRMTAAFKTPTLRNLDFTQPYMHTGGFTTLESALTEIMRLSQLAREGKVREADEHLRRINITEAEVGPLVAFLKTLNDNLKPGLKY